MAESASCILSFPLVDPIVRILWIVFVKIRSSLDIQQHNLHFLKVTTYRSADESVKKENPKKKKKKENLNRWYRKIEEIFDNRKLISEV